MGQAVQTWDFTVTGMSCSKCIRKVRHLLDTEFGISNVSIDLGQKRVRIDAAVEFDRDRFIHSISKLGFAARYIDAQDSDSSVVNHQRRLLAQLGVAAACAGNIMLISVALYAGAADAQIVAVFKWMILLLFLPVLFYSAIPFYTNCFLAIKTGRASVDLPIVLALFAGSILGTYNLMNGSNHFYFDSLSVLVFLILASRYLVQRIQDTLLRPISVSDIFGNAKVKIQTENGYIYIEREKVKRGDTLLIGPGEYLPVDGTLAVDCAEVDNSFLTGESYPALIRKYEPIFAGCRVLSTGLKVDVTENLEGCRINTLIQELNKSLLGKTDLTTATDKAAQVFTYFVLACSAIFLLVTMGSPHIDSLNRVLALLVISCPCVLAIATPLAVSLAVRRGLSLGLLIKRPDVFERAVKIKSIIFDKTGTLTDGEFRVGAFSPRDPSADEKDIVCSLERDSWHPYAKALLRHFDSAGSVEIVDRKETPGVGVAGSFQGHYYEVKKNPESGDVALYKDKQLQWQVALSTELQPLARKTVSLLKARFQNLFILTGDKQQAALSLADQLEVSKESVFANISPEGKAGFVTKTPCVAFVGDGINDCLAMSRSDLAFSMGGSPEATFRSSDIHLVTSDLSAVGKTFELSEKVLRTIKINIAVSFLYNGFFGAAALMGWINPLWAAVLMPISSISVVAHTVYQLGKGGGLK